jgi:hypothetical protein
MSRSTLEEEATARGSGGFITASSLSTSPVRSMNVTCFLVDALGFNELDGFKEPLSSLLIFMMDLLNQSSPGWFAAL